MLNEKINQDITEVNLSEIDWNILSIQEFHDIEKKLLNNVKIAKKQNKLDNRVTGTTVVKIRGKIYKIKAITYERLKTLKSAKAKDKLIEEILSTHNPIEDL